MWEDAVGDGRRCARCSTARARSSSGCCGSSACPEAEIAQSLLAIEARRASRSDRLEITTCLRRGEIEIATVFDPSAAADYDAFAAGIRARHGDTLFSEDGATIDEQVAALLAGRTIAVAESCTGGLMAGRLTDRAGSSAYVLGGVVVYSNEAKIGVRRRARWR